MDATGGLVTKPDSICPAVMNHVIIMSIKSNEDNKESVLVPIAELITCDQTSLNLELFLRHIISKLTSLTSLFTNIADYIVVDWSFAEFNAIIKSQMLTFKEYLDKLFEISENNQNNRLKELTLIASCSSHLTKVVVKDVRLNFNSKKIQNVVIDLVMEIMNFKDFDQLDYYLRNFLVLLKKKHTDKQFTTSCMEMIAFSEHRIKKYELDPVDFEDDKFRELYKNSKFYQKYDTIYEQIPQSEKGALNLYHNEKFARILLKKFIAYLPFFGGPFMELNYFGSRANNGYVEKYFSIEKKENRFRNNNILVPEKVGRYVDNVKASNKTRFIRIQYKIKTNRLAQKGKSSNIDASKDNWKGKSSSKYFNQNFSKKALEDVQKNKK